MAEPVDARKKAKELIMRARIYRLFATIFAIIGVVVFIMLYFVLLLNLLIAQL